MSDVNLDLFGNPVPVARTGPGRPPHVWTLENSHKINLLFACNRTPAEIAKAIGICVPTLRKVYFSEFAGRQIAALKLRGHQLLRLNRQAELGNVAAEKALAALVQSEQLRAASDRMDARTPTRAGTPASAKPPAPGKKAQAAAAAEQVTGLYAPPPEATLLN